MLVDGDFKWTPPGQPVLHFTSARYGWRRPGGGERALDAYLASLRPHQGLYPDDAKKRAIVDQWSYWQAIHLGPAMQRVAFERVMKSKFGMGEPDEKAIAPQLKDIDQFLPVLDANLKDKEWVVGS